MIQERATSKGSQGTPPPAAPRRRWRRWALVGSVLALGLALALAAALWWVVSFDAGARWLVTRVSALVPGTFTVEALHGPVRGPFAADVVSWHHEEVRIDIERLEVEWRLGRLWRRQLDIHNLHVRGVRVWLAAAEEEEPAELTDINLRFNVLLRSLVLEDFELLRGEESEPLVIHRLELDTADLGPRLAVTRLDVLSPHVDLDLAGTLEPVGDYALDLTVGWALRLPEGPELAGRGTLGGTLRRLEVAQDLSAPFPARLEALLHDPLYDLRFEGEARFEGLDPRLFAAEAPELTATGRISGSGSMERFSAGGEVAVASPEHGAAEALFQVGRRGERWDVEQLEITRPGTASWLSARGELVAEPFGFDLSTNWRELSWPLEGEAEVTSGTGGARLEGTPESYRIQLDAELGSPAAGLAPGRWRLDAEGTPQGAVVRNLRAETLGGVLTGGGEAVWEPELTWSVDLTGRGLRPGDVLAEAPAGLDQPGDWRIVARGDGGALTASRIEGELAGGRLAGEGTLAWEPELAWSFAGTVEGLDFSALGVAVPPELGAGSSWRIVARGGDRDAVVEALDGEVLGGTLGATGRLSWAPALSWEGVVRGTGLDPGGAWPGWSGRLDLAARSAAAEGPEGLVGHASLERLEGTLRGRPIAARAELFLAGERLSLTPFDATWEGARIRAEGELGEALDLAFEITELELAAVADGASGELSAQGRLTGPRAAPHLQARLAATGVRLGETGAARVEGEADLDLGGEGPLTLAVEAQGVTAAGQWLEELALTVQGTIEDHGITVTGQAPGLRLGLAAHGAWEGTHWQGELSALDLESPDTGDWGLEAPVAVLAGAGKVEVAELCWVSHPSRLCTSVAWEEGGVLAAQALLDGLPLALLDPFLPPEARIEGELDGNLTTATDAEGRLVADLALRPRPGARLSARTADPPTAMELTGGRLVATTDAGGARARLDLALAGGGTVAGEVALPGWAPGAALEEQPLTGKVHAEVGELGFLETLVEGVTGIAGRLEADLTLAGTAGAPAAAGTLRWIEGRARLPELGLTLEEIALALRGDGTRPLALEGSLRSGAGTLRLDGQVPLAPTAEQPLKIAVRGNGVTVSNTRELTAVASPDLTLAHTGERLEIEGQVEITRAALAVSRPAAEALQPSRWEVFVAGTPPDRIPPGLDLHVRLRLVLGEEVRVSGLGLDSRVRGSLLILDEPDRPTRASGELQLVGGTFQAYGQDLIIEQGRLLFAGGPVANPGLRLRAYRQARDGVRAGVEARGTLEAPEVTLWSEPPMAQSDALAYLLLGRPLEATSEGETDYLAAAATALGLKGGALLAERLGAKWGLEEAAIETGNGLDQAALVLGKYLSPRLFVGYGIGLFDPVSTFRVRYRLTERWALQGESGTATSGDLLYTIERGGPPPAHPPLRWPDPEDLDPSPLPAEEEASRPTVGSSPSPSPSPQRYR